MKWMLPGFFDQPLLQPDLQTPPNTPDTWTTDMDGLWTDTEADPDPLTDSGTDGDLDLWSEIDTDLAADNKMRPRYEDYLRRYLEGDTDLSMLNADAAAAPEKTQQPAPKPKEQILSELAPKISKPGITSGRATIAAQQMYAKAEKHFGDNAEVVLEAYQPGQDPGKFLDGFQNAYIAGKLGNKAALENSTATAYLTQEQRMAAYEMGAGVKNTRPVEYREKRDIITKDKGKTLSPDVQINIPKEKFTAYALDPQKSPDKAKAFKLALGYDLSNYEALIENILENIDVSKFVEKGDRGHGMRYEYILELRGVNGKKANVLTAWISDGEGIRLVTVYVTNKDVRK